MFLFEIITGVAILSSHLTLVGTIVILMIVQLECL